MCDALAHAFERWDGQGHPDGLSGEEVPVAVRIVAAARDAELFHRREGWPAAVDVLTRRRGRGYDPAVVDALTGGGQGWLAEIDNDPCPPVLDVEPPPVRTVAADDVDTSLRAIADFADLKSPWFRGHSTGVAELAVAAGEAADLGLDETVRLGRAALVHDVGQVGVASGIWDHPGRLSVDQRERMRLHASLSERVLRRCDLLAPLADLAAGHHERVDGSGVPPRAGQGPARCQRAAAGGRRRLSRDDRGPPASARAQPGRRRVRAERRGRSRPLRQRRGRRRARGCRPRGPPYEDLAPCGSHRPRGRGVAAHTRGHANKQVAAMLRISPKTVGRHVEHIYAKAEVSTRAGATLLAMEHGLLVP